MPFITCQQIDRAARDFWWGKTEHNTRYYTPVSWSNVRQPKSNGGLGFRRAKDQNEAMLSKFAWLLTSNSSSLAASPFRNKYGSITKPKYKELLSFFGRGLSLSAKIHLQTSPVRKLGMSNLLGSGWIPGSLVCLPLDLSLERPN